MAVVQLVKGFLVSCRLLTGAADYATMPCIDRRRLNLGERFPALKAALQWACKPICRSFSVSLRSNSPMRELVRFFLFAVALPIATCCSAFAQDASEYQLDFMSAVRSHQVLIRPNAQLYVTCRIRNHADEAASAKLIATATGGSDQSECVFEVASQATEFIQFPVRLPAGLPTSGTIEVSIKLVESESGVTLQFNERPQQHVIMLTSGRIRSLAAMALSPEAPPQPPWHWPPPRPYASYELALASRIDAGYTRDAVFFDSAPPPVATAAWKGLSSVIISDERFFDDAAAVEIARQYVEGGGQLWVTLDLVPCELVRPLLGIEQSCEEIDTTELTNFVVEATDSAGQLSENDRRVDSYTPIRLKRVAQSGGEVTHRVDGWPAAIWMQVGKGTILLTTLDRHAWIEPRINPSVEATARSAFQSRPWAQQLAIRAHFNDHDQHVLSRANYPVQLIGNSVLPRSIVMGALGGFCIASIAIAAFLHFGSWNTLWLYAFTPVVAAACAGFLVVSTGSIRQDIPEGVSTLQQVSVLEDGNSATIHEQNAVYLNGTQAMSLQWSGDGIATIASEVSAGITKYQKDDFQQWTVSNDDWPPGTWRYDAEYATASSGLQVIANFDENGVSFELPDLPSALSDPVIEYVSGSPMICTESNDSWRCDGSLTVQGDRSIDSQLLSSEQQRRAAFYESHFSSSTRRAVRDRVLYGWTELWPGGPKWQEDMPQKGAAIVALPIALVRPPSEAKILVPHGLIRLRNNVNSVGATTAFSETYGTWNDELTLGISANMQFVLPPELVPFSAEEISFELDVRAPHRTVRVLANNVGGEPVELANLDSPSIAWKRTITDPIVLANLEDGILDCTVEVSDRNDITDDRKASGVVHWSIEHFRASVRGSVGLRSSLTTSSTSSSENQ